MPAASKGISIFLLMGGLVAGCAASNPDRAWQRIHEQGVMRVGMEASWVPFEYVDGTGQLTGFDVELARTLGDRLGLQVQFVANLSFDGLYDALTAEQVDIVISAVVVDMGRSADFYFSTPYFDAGQVLVVGPGGAKIDDMQALGGHILAVELGSAGDAVARRWARRLADLALLHTDSAGDALAAVAAGRADAALTDRASALMALRELDNANLRINAKPVTGEQYAVLVRNDSRELLRVLNRTLANMRRDGTLDALERKWLGP